MGTRTTRIRRTNADFNLLDADDTDDTDDADFIILLIAQPLNPRYPCHPRLKNNIPNGANHFCSFPFRYEQKSPRMSYTYTSGGSVL